MKIFIGDRVLFEETQIIDEFCGQVVVNEGKVVGILNTIAHEQSHKKNTYLFEVEYVKDNHKYGTKYIESTKIKGKKKYIHINQDVISFKNSDNLNILTGVITNYIRIYNYDNQAREIKYNVKLDNNSIYTIRDVDIIKDKNETICIMKDKYETIQEIK